MGRYLVCSSLIACGGHPADEVRGGECFTCHGDAWAATTAPPHAALDLPRDCALCHGTDAWTPAHFDHTTLYPLRGAHAALPCAACHGDGAYAGTPRICVGCHATDRDVVTDPRHVPPLFADDCARCHTEDAWRPVTFAHETLFPINRGAHSRYRGDCRACHPLPAGFAAFTCTGCHEHPRERMDARHREVAGYRYQDAQCLRCHPNGRGEDAER
jgi:hypothetical protein